MPTSDPITHTIFQAEQAPFFELALYAKKSLANNRYVEMIYCLQGERGLGRAHLI